MIRAMFLIALFVMAFPGSPASSAVPGVKVTNGTDLDADIRMSMTYPGSGPLHCDEYPIHPGRFLRCDSGESFSGSVRVDLWTPIVYPITRENVPKKVTSCRTPMTRPVNLRVVRDGSGCKIVPG
jgi:hypothetical protein